MYSLRIRMRISAIGISYLLVIMVKYLLWRKSPSMSTLHVEIPFGTTLTQSSHYLPSFVNRGSTLLRLHSANWSWNLRNATPTMEDCNLLMSRTNSFFSSDEQQDFNNSMHLYPTNLVVTLHNKQMLKKFEHVDCTMLRREKKPPSYWYTWRRWIVGCKIYYFQWTTGFPHMKLVGWSRACQRSTWKSSFNFLYTRIKTPSVTMLCFCWLLPIQRLAMGYLQPILCATSPNNARVSQINSPLNGMRLDNR